MACNEGRTNVANPPRDWDLEDLLEQIQQVKDLGRFDEVLARIPGLAEVVTPEDLAETLTSAETILTAMTKDERRRPELLTGPDGAEARTRVAFQCGVPVDDVETLVTQFLAARGKLRELMFGQPLPPSWIESLLPRKEDAEAMGSANNDSSETDVHEDTFDERVDEILRKVSRSGLASLTADERGLLDEASRTYKARQAGSGDDDEPEDVDDDAVEDDV